MIGIDHHAIVILKVLLIQIIRILKKKKINSFPGKGGSEHGHIARGVMVFAGMPEEQKFYSAWTCTSFALAGILARKEQCAQ